MRLLRGLGELIENLLFDVATYRRLPDEAITFRPPAWLFDQYERVQRARWGEFNSAVTASEMGVLRGLARAFSKDAHPPDLPTYDDWLAEQTGDNKRLPAWMDKFEDVNRNRRAG